MNLETVLMCAKTTAEKQLSALGYVTPEVQELIDELTAPPAETPAAPAPTKAKKAK